jgi:hypothetical protein
LAGRAALQLSGAGQFLTDRVLLLTNVLSQARELNLGIALRRAKGALRLRSFAPVVSKDRY